MKDCKSRQFQVNVQSFGNTAWNTRAVAIYINNVGVIQLKQGLSISVNGIAVSSYPYMVPADGSRIYRVHGGIRVNLANSGVVIYYDGVHLVEVTVPVDFFNGTCGLCGQYNGDSSDDLQTSNGSIFYSSNRHQWYSSSLQSRVAYYNFGKSWAVKGSDRLLLDQNESCQDSFAIHGDPCFDKPSLKLKAERYCDWIRDPFGPYVDCHLHRNPEESFQSCIFDYCAHGGDKMSACHVAQAYERWCKKIGVTSIGSVIDSCGVCFGDGSSCRRAASCYAFGDHHFSTFDGLWHDFQGRCEYVVAQDCRDNDFSVHVQYSQSGRAEGSKIKIVAVNIKDVGVIRLLPSLAVTVNSRVITSFPYRVPGDGSRLVRTHGDITLYLSSYDVTVTFDGRHFVEVAIGEDYMNRTCGLCGVYDEDAGNDLSLRNGTVISVSDASLSRSYLAASYHNFGVDWAVSKSERLLLSANDSCTDVSVPPVSSCSGKNRHEVEGRRFCNVLEDLQGPYSLCHLVIDPVPYFLSCVLDVCVCNGDTTCGCDSITAYERVCKERGIARLGTVLDDCGVCYGNGSTCLDPSASCHAFGDPHYSTFDGLGHHFQGQCEYILAMDCISSEFVIHVRNEHRYGNANVTYTRTVGIKVPGLGVIRLEPDKGTFVNNMEVTVYPYVVGVDGTVIRWEGGLIRVMLASSAIEVFWNGIDFVQVTIPERYRSRVCGLCGSFDGNSSNDLQLRNGTVLQASHTTYSDSVKSSSAYYEFGVSWSVASSDRLLLNKTLLCKDSPSQFLSYCDNPLMRQKVSDHCNIILNQHGPYAPCHAVVDAAVYYKSCIFDVCSCNGQLSCACSSVDAYERFCRQRGVASVGSVIDKCGVCFGDGSSCRPQGSTCQWYDGSYYITLDNAGFQFQGQCEYVLVQDCAGKEFSVHVGNDQRRHGNLTFTGSVAIRVAGGAVVKLLSLGRVEVNGRELTSFPTILSADGTTVSKVDRLINVLLGNSQILIKWDGASIVEVTVPLRLQNKTCGLCGQYDGVWSNDLKLANETIVYPSSRYSSTSLQSLASYHIFGVSWTIPAANRMLLSHSDICTDILKSSSHPCDTRPVAVRNFAEVHCNPLLDPLGPYRSCHLSNDPNQAYQSCVYSTCACDGNRDCACPSIKAYELRCKELQVQDVGTLVDVCGICFGDGTNCSNDGATAQSPGVDHYLTFDRSGHHFQGACEYYFTKDIAAGDFEVHVRNQRRGSSPRLYTRDVAVRSRQGAVVHLLSGGSVKVNGETITSFPHRIAVDGSIVNRHGKYICISLSNSGVKVCFDGRHLEVSVPPLYRGRLSGLGGNYNDDHTDDLEGGDGVIYQASNRYYSSSLESVRAYYSFAQSWVVNGTERLILSATDSCLDSPPLTCIENSYAKNTGKNYCSFISDPQGPYGKCHSFIDFEFYYESCVFDVCNCALTSQTMSNCACTSVQAYEVACKRLGATGIGSVVDECGVCFGNGSPCKPAGATCQVSGDPHYITFDNSGHHFQGRCEYLLAKDCLNKSKWQIHVRNEHRGNSLVTWTRSIAIKVTDVGVIRLLPHTVVTVNDISVTRFPYVVPGDGSVIRKLFDRIIVFLADANIEVRFDGFHLVQVSIPKEYLNRTCGLCGYYNGDWKDDLKTQNGTVVIASSRFSSSSWQSRYAYHEFGVSWTVSPERRLLMGSAETCKDDDIASSDPCDDQPSLKQKAEKICNVVRNVQGPYRLCHGVADPDYAFRACVFDACACGDRSDCYCGSVLAYEELCRNRGVQDFGTVIDECGVCFGDGSSCRPRAVCQDTGDPHYRTFDGLGHHFQGFCEYVLAKDCTGTDFTIHARSKPLTGSFTVTRSVAIDAPRLGVIKLLKNKEVYVNGQRITDTPYYVGDKAIISRYSIRWMRVRLAASGVDIWWDGVDTVEVSVPERYFNNTCGLCGFYNNDMSDDLRFPDGTIRVPSNAISSVSRQSLLAYHSFGVSWTVQPQDRLLLGINDTCQDPELPYQDPCRGHVSLRSTAETYCSFIIDRNGPYANCHSIVDPAMHYESCLFDTCACGGAVTCACDSVLAYESLCRYFEGTEIGSVVDECGLCFGNGSSCITQRGTCVIAGGAHFMTFDGAGHHFKGRCEYVLVEDTKRNDFVIHIENRPCCGRDTATVKRAVVNIKKVGVILFGDDNSVLLNGKKVEKFPYTVPTDGSRISVINGVVRLWLANSDILIQWNGMKTYMQIDVPPEYVNRTGGLCGTYNGNPMDDLTLRSGTVVEASDVITSQSSQSELAYLEFGRSWAVNDTERLLLNTHTVCQDSLVVNRHPCDVNYRYKTGAENYCSLITDSRGPFVGCHDTVDPQLFYQSCFSETCICLGDVSCGCKAVGAYEAVCRTKGVTDIAKVVDDCGVCLGDGTSCLPSGGICQLLGGSHYTTFDGLVYHFRGHCEYVLTEDCINEDFKIHVINDGGSVTTTKTVIVYVRQTGYIRFYQEMLVEINGIKVNHFPYRIPSDGSVITKQNNRLQLLLASSGVLVWWDGFYTVQVIVPSSYKNRTCGLCGQHNGVVSDDLTERNGLVYTASNPLCTSSVSSKTIYYNISESCIVPVLLPYLTNITVSCLDNLQPLSNSSYNRSCCHIIQDNHGPYSACHDLLPPLPFYESCYYDYIDGNGNKSICCSHIMAYEERCKSKANETILFQTVVDKWGNCCVNGVPIPKSRTCSVSGGSQHTTIDDSHYHFKGNREYVLAKDLSLTRDFAIRVASDLPNAATSTRSVAVTASGLGVIRLLPHGQVFWNNIEVKDHLYVSPDGTEIFRTIWSSTIRMANSEVLISSDGDQAVSVSVPDTYLGRMGGLCGSYDNNKTNDLTLRNGSVVIPSNFSYSNSSQSIKAYHTFGVSWSVTPSKRLLIPPHENRTDDLYPPTDPCSVSAETARVASDFCLFILDLQGPYASCHDLVYPFSYYKSCMFDVCLCSGNVSCGCSVITDYETTCQRRGAVDMGTVRDLCGICFGDGSSCDNDGGAFCEAFGDPHYVTFDGLGHHFQGECEYVLAQDCVTNDFSIHVANERRGGSRVTWTKSVAIRVKNGNIIQLLAGPSVQVSGQNVDTFPFYSGVDGTRISNIRSEILVLLAASGATVKWDGSSAVVVTVPQSYRNKTCGLCGNFDGQRDNDLTVDGVEYMASSDVSSLSQNSQSVYHNFGRRWAVDINRRLIISVSSTCDDTATPPSTPCPFGAAISDAADTFCAFISDAQGPYADCYSTVNPLTYLHGCIYDFCASNGNLMVACQAVASYENICRQKGITSIGSVIDNCGVCFGNGSTCPVGKATCVAAGDPHYTTFDGLGHHFQGRCEYVLAQDCITNLFKVHVLNELQEGGSVSWTRSVAVKVANLGVIKLLKNKKIVVNGQTIDTFPRTLNDGSLLRASANIVTLTLIFGVEVRWDGDHLVEVSVPSKFINKTCGLCGNYNGDYTDDLTLRDGNVLFVSHQTYSWSVLSRASYHAFGLSFAAHGRDRLLLDSTIVCHDHLLPPVYPCNVSTVRMAAEDYCNVIQNRSGPYTLCHSVLDPFQAFESCVFDVCACAGNTSCGCSVIQSYERECRRLGVTSLGTLIDRCGVCYGDGSSCESSYETCQAWGDPHYNTLDGYSYHFQGLCEYVLSRDCLKGDFEIRVQNENRLGGDSVSYTKAVAVKVPDLGVVKLMRDSVFVNGRLVQAYPYRAPRDGTVINKILQSFEVTLGKSGVVINWRAANSFVEVAIPKKYEGRTCGLCGTFDGNSINDLQLRNGSILIASNSTLPSSLSSPLSYHTFGTSWLTSSSERLLLPVGSTCRDRATAPDHPCDVANSQLPMPHIRRQQASQLCSDLIDATGPYFSCYGTVNPAKYFESCLYDECACRLSGSCSCDSFIAYESECLRKGVSLVSIVDACGVCRGDGKSCRLGYGECEVFSDPFSAATGAKQSYFTFDNFRHHFQGRCEYTLARDCIYDSFRVQIENEEPRSSVIHTAWTTGIGIYADGLGLVKILHKIGGTDVYLNGLMLSSPSETTAIDGSKITLNSLTDTVMVHLASSDVLITAGGDYQVVVSVPPSFKGHVCGLCGNYNGNISDDLALANETVLRASNVNGSESAVSVSSYHAFGRSWAVPVVERFILNPQDDCLDELIVPWCDRRPENKENVEEFCDVIKDTSGPFVRCHGVINPESPYGHCVLDICARNGSLRYGCASIKSYEGVCQRRLKTQFIPSVADCANGTFLTLSMLLVPSTAILLCVQIHAVT